MLKQLLALAAALGATALAVSASDALPASRASVWTCPGTAVLTAMPTLGIVEWRSEYKAGRARFSLGLHTFDTVSMGVRLRTGAYSADRFVNAPGGPTLWFGYSTNHVQWLAADWIDEAGFVAGVARVDFSQAAARVPRSQDCWIFAPPQVTVHFYGHHHPFYGRPPGSPFRNGGFGGMLRPWPIR